MADSGSGESPAETEQPQQQLRKRRTELDGWSTRVEDLVDGGDEEGAVQLLEKVVETLQMRGDVSTNLGLAAALNDMGRLYAAQGLSLKSDNVFNSALLIKERNAAQQGDSWEDKVDDVSPNGLKYSEHATPSESRPNVKDLGQHDLVHIPSDSVGEPSTAGEREEDWETLLDALPTPCKPSSSAIHKERCSKENAAANKRGRGSFTYGRGGMYSDHHLEVTAGESNSGNGSDQSDIYGGASHVLVLSFSPKIKTRDLEELVKPYLQNGSCSIRWIDDTRALAVFSSPALARDALDSIKDARFKVSAFSEASEIAGMLPSIKDLAPPAPRPTSSARVAQRMIASALSRQGVNNAVLARNPGSALEIQKQESQRKDRLQSRAKLRDEAWGPED